MKDHTGRVLELNLRTTRIKTCDGKDIYVPNAVLLKESVTNFTRDGFIRQDFVVGTDYDADVPAVMATIMDQLRQEAEVLQTAPHEPFVTGAASGGHPGCPPNRARAASPSRSCIPAYLSACLTF